MKESSRRNFLRATAAAISAGAGLRGQGSSGDSARVSSAPLSVFNYSQVQLLDGPLRRQFDTNHEFFLHLDEDRMLKIYRQRVGLPAPGPNMGGWYDDFCPGASFGQYVSALARYAGATGSKQTQAKVKRLVKGYAETVDPSGKFFVDLRYPAYTYDKLICGLIDAHSFAGDSTALGVLAETTRAALPHIPERALTGEELRQRPHKDETYTWDESYTLAENLFLAYERSGDRQYYDLGRRYLLDRSFFDPLAEGQNVLPGLHAYSHVNALSSGMQGYLKLGDRKYLRAVTNAVNMIWEQSYATGGWGPNEGFIKPGSGALGASLDETHRSFETPCGGYAHLKVCRYLLALTRDARYGDSIEQVLYNTLLGVKPILEDGSSFYYSDYHHAAHKTYRRVIPRARWAWDLDDKWPCCSGTYPQVTADYVISSYFRSNDGIYVNLFVPSRVTWSRGDTRCTLVQETGYPAESLVTLTMTTSRPAEFTVWVRIPAWAGKGTSVSVNGSRVRSEPVAGTFHGVRRTWKTGDKIELEIGQPLRLKPVDAEHPEQVALVRGPQVLFGIGQSMPSVSKKELVGGGVRESGDGWVLRTQTGEMKLRGFGTIGEEVYQTYFGVTG